MLISVHQKVHNAGSSITIELQGPFNKLQKLVFPIVQLFQILQYIIRAFENVKQLLIKEAHQPFIKQYLKQDDIMCKINACNVDIQSALDMFNVCFPLWFIVIYIYLLLSTALCFNLHGAEIGAITFLFPFNNYMAEI